MKLSEYIFSVKNENNHKVLRLLGVRLKFKNKYYILKETINFLSYKLGVLVKNNDNLAKKLSKKADKLADYNKCMDSKLSNKLDIVTKIVNETSAKIDKNTELYNSDVERKVVENFYEYYDKNFNLNIYKNLILNLPKEDIDLVDKIIIRQRKIKGTYGKPIDLFTENEKKEIKLLKENFYGRILRIEDNIYKWQNYYLPVGWFEPCVLYYKHGMNYIKNLENIKNKNIIDAGGFIGDSALILSEYTNKFVYSFEPTPKSQEYFRQTIALNDLKNVKLEPFALGDENKEVEFNINASSSSVNEFNHTQIKEKIKVNMITLDEYVQANNIEVGLIKTDLEGAEQLFLNGAKNTICTQKPTLLISIYHNPKDFFEIKPMLDSWDLGYKFRIIKGIDNYISLETMLIAEAY